MSLNLQGDPDPASYGTAADTRLNNSNLLFLNGSSSFVRKSATPPGTKNLSGFIKIGIRNNLAFTNIVVSKY